MSADADRLLAARDALVTQASPEALNRDGVNPEVQLLARRFVDRVNQAYDRIQSGSTG